MASARLIRRASVLNRNDNDEAGLEPLLGEEALLDENDRRILEETDSIDSQQVFAPNPFADLRVYDNIWRIRRDILDAINDPYSYEQIRGPRLNTTVVRPLLEKYYALEDISIVFSLLVNRVQFLKDQSYQAHYQSVSTTRALLCEILALRLLRQFDADSSGPDGLLLLANIVIAGFDAFQNAPTELSKRSNWAVQDRGGYERQMTALEVAILSDSKLFLSTAATQKVVDAIYTGRLVYTPTSFIDILPDHYKHRLISIYNPKRAPLLNTYRLSVPRTRNGIEIFQFIVLLFLYFLLMTAQQTRSVAVEEWIFVLYTLGWILDQLSSVLEHGWQVYSQNLWSFLDVAFSTIFLVYLALRIHGVSTDTAGTSRPALDILAMGAPFLVPRLAFNLFSSNLLFVSLRDMMSKFLLLTFLAVWSFAGFYLAMIWLNVGSDDPVPNLYTIMWLIWVWFGLDGTGVQRSTEFHWLLGPLLMVAFAILGNTLFLTILVSTLSDSYSKIASRAPAEIQFRKAVLTFQGVKSDAIFAYPPPFNILALVIFLPMKLILSPRWFHKVNVSAVRILNAPLLVLINILERRYLWPNEKEVSRKTLLRKFSSFDWFHVHGDIQAVFEAPPPGYIDKPSDLMQARRRKSLRVCAPDQESQSPTLKLRPGDMNLRRSSSSQVRPVGRGDAGDIESRLERIEEMLEQIGKSNDDEEEDT